MAIFLSADIEVVVIVRPFGVTIVFDCPPHTSSDIHSENEKHCLTFSILFFFLCLNLGMKQRSIIMVNKMKSGMMAELKNMQSAELMKSCIIVAI